MDLIINMFGGFSLDEKRNEEDSVKKPLINKKNDGRDVTSEASSSDNSVSRLLLSVIDPLIHSEHVSYEAYLLFTSTCKSMNKNRFESMSGRVEFLDQLFSRMVLKDASSVIGARILERFSENTYTQELHLSVSGKKKFDQEAFTAVAKKFQNIKKLHFAASYVISCKSFFDSVKLCQKLTHLRMPHLLSEYYTGGQSKSIPQSIQSLWVAKNIAEIDLLAIIGCSVNLEKLNLSDSYVEESFFGKVIFPRTLRRLNLDDTYLHGRDMQKIIKECEKLEWISLRECETVTATMMQQTAIPSGLEVRFEECEEF